MKLGLIVYSESGHTLSVVSQIEGILIQKQIEVKKMTLHSQIEKGTRILVEPPQLESCDAYIIASAVQGFQLAKPMSDYLVRNPLPRDAKIGILLTEYFKVMFLGGNYSLKQAKATIDVSSHPVVVEKVIHWSSKKREEQIKEAVTLFTEVWDE